MKSDFVATWVHVEDMGDYLLVGLSDQQFETSDYLVFQRAHEFDEQDVLLGMDTVYLERNDQGFSGYGGIESVSLFRDHLDVSLNAKGSAFMDGFSRMKVSLELDAAALQELRKGLVVCFEGFLTYHDEVDPK